MSPRTSEKTTRGKLIPTNSLPTFEFFRTCKSCIRKINVSVLKLPSVIWKVCPFAKNSLNNWTPYFWQFWQRFICFNGSPLKISTTSLNVNSEAVHLFKMKAKTNSSSGSGRIQAIVVHQLSFGQMTTIHVYRCLLNYFCKNAVGFQKTVVMFEGLPTVFQARVVC